MSAKCLTTIVCQPFFQVKRENITNCPCKSKSRPSAFLWDNHHRCASVFNRSSVYEFMFCYSDDYVCLHFRAEWNERFSTSSRASSGQSGSFPASKNMPIESTVMAGAVWCLDLCSGCSSFNSRCFWTLVDGSTEKRQITSGCCYENSCDLPDHLAGLTNPPGTQDRTWNCCFIQLMKSSCHCLSDFSK